MKIIIRCDGGARVGMGHVVRCLALADELKKLGAEVSFAMIEDEIGIAKVCRNNYNVYVLESGSSEADWMMDLLQGQAPDIVVMDFRTDLPRSEVLSWRSLGVRIATIDDPSPRRLEAEWAFYPPIPQIQAMDWSGFQGKLCAGWDWVLLRPEFAVKPVRKPHEIPNILVTMGGSDPFGMTLMALRALMSLEETFETRVVLGPAFCQIEELERLLANSKRAFLVYKGVSDIWNLMAECDLAIASFGVTAYELAAMGLPALHLCLSDDHAQSASAFEKAGIAINLGVFRTLNEKRLSDCVKKLLSESMNLSNMASKAETLVDGLGSKRIAQKLLNLWN